MTQNKKYDYRVVQDGASWRAEIVRQVTTKTSRVSKSQTDFPTAADAQVWAEEALKAFSENLNERNKRQAEKRQQKARLAEEKQLAQEALKAARDAEKLVVEADDAKAVLKTGQPDADFSDDK